MEHEIVEGEQFLDYIVERITLQDALPLVLRLLVLYSLVNGGLRDKDFDTVRKEVIQVWKNDWFWYRLMDMRLYELWII